MAEEKQELQAQSYIEIDISKETGMKLARKVPKAWVKQSLGRDSLPVSFVEKTLDELFGWDGWQTCDFRHLQVFNEVTGTITLKVYSPRTGWIERQGAAAVQIMLDAGSKPFELEKKKPNGLETPFPKLKAMAFKNAAKTLGRLLGRDLGRGANAENISDGQDEKAKIQFLSFCLESPDIVALEIAFTKLPYEVRMDTAVINVMAEGRAAAQKQLPVKAEDPGQKSLF